jgi:3-oxoacyl-[acyl-carrier protein] reductase
MDIPRRLVDRVAVVTGAGHGIGKAYARRLAQEGARVVIAELDGAAGEAAADELRRGELEVIAVQTDVADEVSCQRMVDQTVAAYGKLDILVNNAAIFVTIPMSRSTFDQIDPDEWDRLMKVNLKGTWLACRAAVPVMRRNGYGKIINISSGTAFKGAPTRIHYVTTKAGITGFTRTLARELGRDGITVNCIAPGSTLSEADPDEATLRFRESAIQERAIPRVQKPEDLVGAMAFFASPDSDFVTGQTLLVDGGAFMH